MMSIALFLVLLFYFNLCVYLILSDLSYIRSLRDYFRYSGGLNITTNATMIIFYLIFWVIENVNLLNN